MNTITPITTGQAKQLGNPMGPLVESNLFFTPAVLEPAMEHLAPGPLSMVQGVPIRSAVARFGPLSPPGPLTVWHHPYSMVGVPPLDHDDPTASLEALADAILATFKGASVLLMPHMRTDGPAWQTLCAWLDTTDRRFHVLEAYDRAGHRFPADDTSRLDDLRGKKSASAIRSKRRKLEKLGSVEDRFATRGTDLTEAVDQFLNLEASGWKGKSGTAMKTMGHGPFVQAMAARLAERDRVRVDLRTLDGAPVAGTIFLRDGTDAAPLWMPWKIAYDEHHAGLAPGMVTLYDVTETLMDEARAKGTSIAFDSLTDPGSVVFNRLWPHQRWHLADVLVDLQPGGSRAFQPMLMAEKARLKARSTAKQARDMVRAALRKTR